MQCALPRCTPFSDDDGGGCTCTDQSFSKFQQPVPRLLFQWCYVLMEEHKPVIQLRQEATESSEEWHCGRKDSRRRIVPSCPAQGVSVTGQQFCPCDEDPWEYSELEEFGGKASGVGGEHPHCICRHVMMPPFLLCYKVFWRWLVHLPVCSLPFPHPQVLHLQSSALNQSRGSHFSLEPSLVSGSAMMIFNCKEFLLLMSHSPNGLSDSRHVNINQVLWEPRYPVRANSLFVCSRHHTFKT